MYIHVCVHVFSTQYVSIIYENVHVIVLIRSQVIHIPILISIYVPILTYRYILLTSICMASFQSSLDAGYIIRHTISC